MKILLLCPYFYPESNAAAVRGQAFAKYLSKEGAEVSVIVPEKSDIPNDTIKYEGCRVDRIKTYNTIGESHHFLFSLLYLPFSIFELIRKIKKNKPNLIIASIPSPFLALEGLCVAKYLGVPIILDVRDTWIAGMEVHEGALRNKIKILLEKLICSYVDLIFSVTPLQKKTIVEVYNIPQSKIKVVYNGADLEIFSKIKINKEVDFIHLGGARVYYDTLNLIVAFSYIVKKLPNIVGCLDDNYTEDVKKCVKKLDLFDNIILLPQIPYEKVPIELAKARIGVISLSFNKAFEPAIGVKTYEYMAMGLPTAYLGPSNNEQYNIIKINNVGVCSSNPKEFAEKCLFLLENEKIREEMGKNALEVVKKYDRKRIVKEAYEKYIKPLVESENGMDRGT